jgi:nucleoid-associated protein YejK
MFFIGLLMCFLSSSIFLYLSWYALHYKTGPFQHISTYIISLIIEYFALNGLCKTMIFLACIVNWYLFWYLFIEIYSISSGLTVNETLNLHRYKYLFRNFICIDGTRKVQYFNRFNKGFVENWMEFIIN